MAKALLVALSFMGIASVDTPLKVVDNLDRQKYLGQWFEIARFPNRFQKDCASDVIAEYSERSDGRIAVRNRCRTEDGSVKDAEGVARQVEGAPASVLQVRFAPAFLSFLPMVWGDYQVIALDDAHTYSLVGTPDREYLWILARQPHLDNATYSKLLETARDQGFDVARIVKTPQAAPATATAFEASERR